MSNQFKPGDLALTIYPLPSVEAGTVVVLDRRLGYGEQFKMFGQTYTALAVGWICSRPDHGDVLAYAETSLMPLRGDFQPERQQSREVPA